MATLWETQCVNVQEEKHQQYGTCMYASVSNLWTHLEELDHRTRYRHEHVTEYWNLPHAHMSTGFP